MAPHNQFVEQFQQPDLDQHQQKEQYYQQQSYNNHGGYKGHHGFPGHDDFDKHDYDDHHNLNNHGFNNHGFNNHDFNGHVPKNPIVFPTESFTVDASDVGAGITEEILTATTEASAAAAGGGSDLGGVIEEALGAISGNSTGSASGVDLDISGALSTEIAEIVTESVNESVTEIAEVVTEGGQSSFDLATTVKEYFESDNGEIDSGLQHHFNNAAHNVDYHSPHSDDEKKYLTLIIILAVMVVLALIALGIYLYKKRQSAGFNQMSGVNVVGKAYEPGRFGESEKKSAQMHGEHSKGASSSQIDESQLKHPEKTPIKGVKN